MTLGGLEVLDYNKSFIEVQFPVSKVSKESYKERKAGASQTLTGLGKWWGRKPLILVRATVLGVLLPVSDNPKKDREIFLKLLTMDSNGLFLRKSKNLSTKDIYALLTSKERDTYFDADSKEDNPKYRDSVTGEDKASLQVLVFNRLSYDGKLVYCDRPEHIENLQKETWDEINIHLGTSANSFNELVSQLGQKRFGHAPKVGDCFTGGGSISFESSRLGCDTYASDLNPIASLLTWSALNIMGASESEIEQIHNFQQRVYNAVDKQIIEWGIEHNENGHRADVYLYCNEVVCPECGYKVPLFQSFIVGQKTKTIIKLLNDGDNKRFNIKIVQDATLEDYKKAGKSSTLNNYKLVCPHCKNLTPIPAIRKDQEDGVKRLYRYSTPNALRKWGKGDFSWKDNDIYSERLYCIRYVETLVNSEGKEYTQKYFTEPTQQDIEREKMALGLLSERFDNWQKNGIIPDSKIEEGWKTNELVYEKGWTFWHHPFTPRQLLMHGLLISTISKLANNQQESAVGILLFNKCCDRNSVLCRWDGSSEKAQQTFYNQAFNTLFNYVCRGWSSNRENVFFNITSNNNKKSGYVELRDAISVSTKCDYWITDPPYADAVNYHELSEFFLAWDKKMIESTFPDWYTDSKRVLAVKGTGSNFNESMIEIYKNLANHMPDSGMQVVMFTHQDVKVWAELAMIIWSSGLRVVSAWNVATETDASGLRNGNYVKGTVLLVLRKQTSENIVFLDELYEEIKEGVKFQIDSMRDLDDKEDPNFTDADYLLASYASSLKVLTSYKEIQGIDVKYELSKSRNIDKASPIEEIINKAIKIAYDYLIPEGIDKMVWRDLHAEERFFIRGLELESNNIYQLSAYQELARGFGVTEYKDMFENFKANTVRLKTATEYKTKGITEEGFGNSLVRHLLVALYLCSEAETTVEGKNYLKTAFGDNSEYWSNRPNMIELLEFISRFERIEHMNNWHGDSYYAKLLKETLKNDGV